MSDILTLWRAILPLIFAAAIMIFFILNVNHFEDKKLTEIKAEEFFRTLALLGLFIISLSKFQCQ